MSPPPDNLERLTPAERRQLLETVLRKKAAQNQLAPPALTRADRSKPLPLSHVQEGVWLHSQLFPDSNLQNVISAYTLNGPLDAGALEQAFAAVHERHELLRTTLTVQNGQPVQVIHPPGGFRMEREDLSALDPAAQAAAVSARVDASLRPFDLQRGPLMRVSLSRLSDTRHTLILSQTHMVTDLWSLGVLFGELASFYAAALEGRVAPLPPLPIQYADFAAWERSWLKGPELERRLDYWRGKLAGAPELLELPLDRPRLPNRSPTAAFVDGGAISAEATAALRRLAAAQRATPFMVLLSAYAVVLSRHSGQQEVVIGSPTAQRSRPELEGMLGSFLNTVALRLDLSGNPSFGDLVGRARDTALEAFSNQDVQFEQVVSALQLKRATTHLPLVQVTLVHDAANGAGGSALSLPGISVEEKEIYRADTRADLGLGTFEEEGRMRLLLGYASDLFEPGTIERMLGHLRTLLEAAVLAPDRRIDALPLLTPAEDRRLRVEFNATAAPRPEGTCVHQLFEAQVQRTPDAVAVVAGDQTLSYRQLEERANRLAHLLISRGVGPEGRVALCLSPSADTLVAMLAVLKAGGAYVPLDTDAPPERLAAILATAGVELVLAHAAHREKLPAPVPVLDPSATPLEALPTAAPPCRTGPRNLAYVIYTSGSTGEPKGVMVEHASVVNHNLAVSHRFGLTAADRVLQFTPVNFDAAGEEIYPPLLCGASVFVQGELIPTGEMSALVDRHQLTVLSLPPAFLHEWTLLLDRQRQAPPSCLRVLIMGGEKLLPETLALWRGVGGGHIPWFNVYGPTEATITSALCEVTRGDLATPVLPIGRPVENAQIYLVDPQLRLVPQGQAGELYIGGAGLARGYLGRPDQTAERFLPDPFGPTPGARLYRTGDLARYLPDGELEFVGRADNQVKIRGFRVELGEVESTLRKYPGITEALVLARQGGPAGTELVGALVCDPAQPVELGALRAFVLSKLPHYMVPSGYLLLPSFPLTANGKVDRKALAGMEVAGGAPSAQVSPRSALEVQLVRIWEEVLEVNPIGVTDDFFELGGQSLLAMRLLSQTFEELGMDLPMLEFFDRPTIEAMAQNLLSADEGRPVKVTVPIQTQGTRPPLFLAHVPGGDVASYFRLVRQLGTDQPCYGLQAPDLFSDALQFGTLEERVAHYLQEVREVQPRGPYSLAGWSSGGFVAYELAQQLLRQGEEVAFLGLLDTQRGTPPLQPSAHDQEDPELFRFVAGAGLDLELFARTPAEERWPLLLEESKRINLFPSYYSMEQLRRFAAVVLANLRECAGYTPGPYPGRLTVFTCAPTRAQAGADLGWGEVCADVVGVPIPGTHDTLVESPQVETVAERVRESLDRVRVSKGDR